MVKDTRNQIGYEVPRDQYDRMRSTCFRDGQALAGNFQRWHQWQQVLRDPDVGPKVFAEAAELCSQLPSDRNSFNNMVISVDADHPIGWVGFAHRADLAEIGFDGFPTEKYQPNKHTFAERVVHEESGHVFAPMTRRLTMICTFHRKQLDGLKWICVIWTMYPGDYIELGRPKRHPRRYIDPDEEGVFFGFNHPGCDLIID